MREGPGRGAPPGCPAWAHGAWSPLTLLSALVAPWIALLSTGHALSLRPCRLLGRPLFLGLGLRAGLTWQVLPGWAVGYPRRLWGGQGHDLPKGGRQGASLGRPWDLLAHAHLPPPADEDVCVFKCSVSRETECSRVGKQSFIITLGCNSVLIQFATPNGT